MKYRIKKDGHEFYPQYRVWYIWIPFREYDREAECNRYIYFSTLEEADKYLDKKKKENEVIIYNR